MHEHKNLMTALLKAKSAMGALLKDAKNPHFKSTYASLSAVVDVLRQPLTDNGIVYIESPVPELEPGRIAIDLTICHAASGESITYRSPVMVAQQQTPQAIGSALTYARRYQLMTVFGLAPEDDDGNEGTKATQPQRQAQQPPTHRQPAPTPSPANGNGRKPPTTQDEVEYQVAHNMRHGKPLTDEVPADDVGMVSNVQLKRLNALGTQLYGSEWNDDKRHALVAWKTKNRTQSSKDLTADEADSLITGLQRKINEAAASMQTAPQEQPTEDGALWQPEPA